MGSKTDAADWYPHDVQPHLFLLQFADGVQHLGVAGGGEDGVELVLQSLALAQWPAGVLLVAEDHVLQHRLGHTQRCHHLQGKQWHGSQPTATSQQQPANNNQLAANSNQPAANSNKSASNSNSNKPASNSKSNKPASSQQPMATATSQQPTATSQQQPAGSQQQPATSQQETQTAIYVASVMHCFLFITNSSVCVPPLHPSPSPSM